MHKRRRGIRTVLITSYLITMAVAMLVGFLILQKIEESSESKASYVVHVENTRTFANLLDLFLDRNIYTSLEITVNEQVQQVLMNNNKLDKEAISRELNKYLTYNPDIQSIHIADSYGRVISEYKLPPNKKSEENFLSQLNMYKVNESQGREYIGIGKNYMGGQTENTLYIARSIYSKQELKRIGYLIIFLEPEAIREASKDYLQRTHMEILLMDEEENLFSLTTEGKLENRYKAYLNSQEQNSQWNSKYDHVELMDDALKLRILADSSKKVTSDNILNIAISVTLINVIFLCIVTLTLGKRVVYPLENIALKARAITEEEDLSIKFETDEAYSETGLIGQALNEMLTKIILLMEEAKEKDRLRRILELSVINHQVNPHFLYNTLNSVGVLVAIEDKETAQKLIQSLSRYYRACLNQSDTNTIRQELAITKEYINIMLLKNPNLFTITYDIDEDIAEKKLPRMILQTLIENSIKYGIKTIEEPLAISIKIKRVPNKECMILEVWDNGKGMEEEIRQSILKEKVLHDKSGFGLRSIIKRISLMYEMPKIEDIFDIQTEKDKYTQITIYIPLKDDSE